MILKIAAILFLALAPLEIRVNWEGTGDQDALRVSVSGDNAILKECVQSGLEARFRYEMRLCRKRSYWVDSCGDVRSEIHSVQLDPINESFKVKTDRLGDKEGPGVHNIGSLDDALAEAASVRRMPLSFLSNEGQLLTDRSRHYVALRVLSECRGEYSQTMERISYIVSLGLLRASGYDSGWIAFSLEH